MAATEQEKEFYRLEGRVNGHDEEIGGMRGAINEIHGMVGGINDRLDRVLGSGPQVALRQPEEATEPKTDTTLGKAERILKNPVTERLAWIAALLVVIVWLISAKTERPVSDFLNFSQDGHRSSIGPIDRAASEAPGPSGKPTTRETVAQ